ncbi:putative Proline synthase co-transcribed bacterial-like protein [Hypsibius exemplaris]|uniref:Pyridoxal phosphate homeostasis protein n=1 Tax=Hypsibius exemplaris TaxID=2072580 RepID=A0A1W0XFE8_HYPEX|nr:putative Proline synthase co-transcribed bacterial-like protein [Hypsibius exemplaris]
MAESLPKSLQIVRDRMVVAVTSRKTISKAPLLVAVSKTKPVELILEAYAAGQRHFGENYIQELFLKAKDPKIVSECPDIRWHFIGHLQTNKCTKTAGIRNVWLFESIDTTKLASTLNASILKSDATRRLNVMLQVNTSREPNKYGFQPEAVVEAARFVTDKCPALRLTGLMTIGAVEHSVDTRPNPDFLKMLSNWTLGVVAGVTAAVGYCVYFDHKRRSDPQFRQKVLARRARATQAANRASGMPDPSDAEAVQRYFMMQLQRGEACLMNGMLEESITHFCNAVRASGSPSQILRILSESLPPQVFNLIVKRLSEDPESHVSMQPSSRGAVPPPMRGAGGSGFPGLELEVDESGDGLGRRGSGFAGQGSGATVTLVLKELQSQVCEQLNLPSDALDLSMGMSSDFEHAIEMGSTEVRVGSLIFGSRVYKAVANNDSSGDEKEEQPK